MNTVIVKPIITEKAMSNVGSFKYTFAVARNARKETIKKAIDRAFHVNVVSISTSVMKGKKRRAGVKRVEVTGSEWKKATVTLKKGEKISLFESGAEEKK